MHTFFNTTVSEACFFGHIFSRTDWQALFASDVNIAQNPITLALQNFDPEAHIAFMDQVHGIDAKYIKHSAGVSINRCDAVYTCESNVLLAVQTADCIPILLYIPSNPSFVVAIHAGWMGILNGVIENTLKTISPDKHSIEKISVYIGPHIRDCCYVQDKRPELLQSFAKKFGHEVLTDNALNLTYAVMKIFHTLGIQDIHMTTECTSCDERFPSHYKEGDNRRKTIIHTIQLLKE